MSLTIYLFHSTLNRFKKSLPVLLLILPIGIFAGTGSRLLATHIYLKNLVVTGPVLLGQTQTGKFVILLLMSRAQLFHAGSIQC